MQNIRYGFNKGKVVYFVDGHRFLNDKDSRNGKEKAVQYCLESFIDVNSIMKFDSILECDRYEYLLALQNQGKIRNLAHHFVLLIQDKFINANGDEIPAITYEADFIYFDITNNKKVIEDVKGSEYFINQDFLILKKVFDKCFLEKKYYLKVVLNRDKKWIEWKIGEKKKSQKLIIKQRNALNSLKKEKHDKLIEERKKTRILARYKQLKEKEKLTTKEKERLKECESILQLN